MSQPTLLGLFSPAPQSVTVSPLARAARRSGLRVARTKAPRQMLEYRACLQRIGPASDQEVARVLGWPIATVNGRRNDWIDHAFDSDNPMVVPAGRVMVTHPDGKRTSRTLWRWVGPR